MHKNERKGLNWLLFLLVATENRVDVRAVNGGRGNQKQKMTPRGGKRFLSELSDSKFAAASSPTETDDAVPPNLFD